MARLTATKTISSWSPAVLFLIIIGCVCFSVFAGPLEPGKTPLEHYVAQATATLPLKKRNSSLMSKKILSGVYAQLRAYATKTLRVDQIQTMPQTAAYLAQEELFSGVAEHWVKIIADNEGLERIFRQSLERERCYSDTHYVFYHGQAAQFRILQDVLGEVYTMLSLKPVRNFTFLRFWGNAAQRADIAQHIVDYGTSWHTDHDDAVMKKLLAVNLSLFGNTAAAGMGECTFDFFLRSSNIHFDDVTGEFLQQFLQEVFDYYQFNPAYMQELVRLKDSIDQHAGTLIQIFIPRDKVNSFSYISSPFGIPYKKLADIIRKEKDIAIENEEHPSVALCLDYYKDQPAMLDTPDYLQGRILFSLDGMLNPQSGIKIYRYTFENSDLTLRYRRTLRSIVQRMFAEWIEKKVMG